MSKYYKVPLFQCRDNTVSKVDDIIVDRRKFAGTREIVSEILIDEYRQKEGPTAWEKELIEEDIRTRGYYLFVRKIDMQKENIPTPEEVESYVASYGTKPIKDVVFQIFENERKVKVKK